MMIRWLPFFVNVTALLIGFKIKSRQLSQLSFWQLLTIGSAAIYVMIIGYLTLAPTSYAFVNNQQVAPMMIGSAPVNLIPFWSTTADFYQNVMMMLPFGVYLALLLPTIRFRNVVLTGAIVGVGIETLQLILDLTINLSRWVDINDVLTNACGVVIGWLMITLANRTPLKQFIKKWLI
ncbi:VanZ family protein [Lentilactobacillus kisonensis]|uniref:VanZ-like protein n=2 Tax=Lentilactobacillus kisonensis TaxID=481722 RepID=A0A0R1NTG6_9LACO|nr:VanZ family protein [Lentilactobacillus kisonensis]KRL21604.1 VanZ-like protein [Lentilactobacillus kisonensis DSM 19906 = JCM 15041]